MIPKGQILLTIIFILLIPIGISGLKSLDKVNEKLSIF
ncbi:hypothetical protein DFP93_10613 [Aneurinibacillus soli]|uniref:Uncharacterized protein n=1 Tax=Aneurinibacillus soli TaxID=1500254 RepID=A0A0U5BDE5_9BACL|nr:hypothetical protein DFP93_10613 [Aneurinibacillus soli]BAU29638.1 hypothetical protein CB4_03875 [Aneurinibacillus soli]